MAVSIRQVAARAGVAVSTASQAMNGVTAARIAPGTQARVRQAAEELGYRPNSSARSMGRGGRTDTVGLMISGLRNPVFVELLEIASDLCRAGGYEISLDTAASVHGTYQGHGKLTAWAVDGVLMWASAYQTINQYLGSQADELPVVYLGLPRSDETDWVGIDIATGLQAALTHVYERGRRRILHITPYAPGESRHERLRITVYERFCADAGIAAFYLSTQALETREAGRLAGAQIAAMPPAERPDALYCHNDVMAIGVYVGLREAGLRVPDDVALFGLDGIEETRYLDVPLTTIRSPLDALCRHALETLRVRMASDRSEPPRQIVLPAELIIRQST